MKILVVDDEMVSRTKLKLIMENFGECEAVASGKDAIAVFHKAHREGSPFDLILLDINMPGMDGVEVLSAMVDAQTNLAVSKNKKAKILMVTSFTDKDRVLSCIQSGCDDYIAKPFDMNTIGKKLSKHGIRPRAVQSGKNGGQESDRIETSRFIDGIVSAFEGRKINLPTLPKIHAKFRELMVIGADSHRIANLLKRDVAISAELIRMSNSAYYRGFMENKSLEQAISRIGAAATEQAVAELTGREFFTMKTKKYRSLIEKIWLHSIACAYASEITVNLIKLELKVDPFAMGLLHDIGKLALLQIIADLERRGKFNGGLSTPRLIETITTYHAPFGAKLLEKWKYADTYIRCASGHGDRGPDKDEDDQEPQPKEIQIVQFANMAAKSMGYHLGQRDYSDLVIENDELAYDLKLNLIDITKLQEKLAAEMKRVKELL